MGDRSRAHCVRRDSFPRFPTCEEIAEIYPFLDRENMDDVISELAKAWVVSPKSFSRDSRHARKLSTDGPYAASWIDCSGGKWKIGARTGKKPRDYGVYCQVEGCGAWLPTQHGLRTHIGLVHASSRKRQRNAHATDHAASSTLEAVSLADPEADADDEREDEDVAQAQPVASRRSLRLRRPFASKRYVALSHESDDSNGTHETEWDQVSLGESEDELLHDSNGASSEFSSDSTSVSSCSRSESLSSSGASASPHDGAGDATVS